MHVVLFHIFFISNLVANFACFPGIHTSILQKDGMIALINIECAALDDNTSTQFKRSVAKDLHLCFMM